MGKRDIFLLLQSLNQNYSSSALQVLQVHGLENQNDFSFSLRSLSEFVEPNSILISRNICQKENDELHRNPLSGGKFKLPGVSTMSNTICVHTINTSWLFHVYLFSFKAVKPSEMLSTNDKKATMSQRKLLTCHFQIEHSSLRMLASQPGVEGTSAASCICWHIRHLK